MSDNLDFSLPQNAGAAPRRAGAGRLLLGLVLLAVLANIAVTIVVGRRSATGPGKAAAPAPTAETQKNLALRLEKQGLHTPAAEAWREYLAVAAPQAKGRATIWYRIGKLHQDAGDYAGALESYYRSEAAAKLEELAPEIGRRIQECLEGLGRFAALRQELAQRVAGQPEQQEAGDVVVAEIGPQKITSAQLDRMIEQQIESQLAQYGAHLPPPERNRQKEALLKRVSAAKDRLQFLNQFLMEEILHRKARELKLTDDPAIRAMLLDTERKILAHKLLEQRLTDEIKITPGDVKTYYEAHQADYIQPARARISHILVDDQEKARAAIAAIEKSDTFEDLARSISTDEATAAKGGELPDWLEAGRPHAPGIGAAPDLVARVFQTDPGNVIAEPVKTDKGYHVIKVREREPQRQKTFAEVQQEAYAALRAQKENEVRERFLSELRDEYNLVIHFSEFGAGQDAATQADEKK